MITITWNGSAASVDAGVWVAALEGFQQLLRDTETTRIRGPHVADDDLHAAEHAVAELGEGAEITDTSQHVAPTFDPDLIY